MLLTPSGAEASKTDQPEAVEPEKTEDQKREEMLSRPFLGVDANGIMTLHIPLKNTDEVTARGLADFARSRIIEWYAKLARARAQEQSEVARITAKGGFRQLAEKLMRRK